jgi:chromosome segregation and condensation protein ScpB
MGLIDRESEGRNKILRSTEFFADYFGLSHNLRIMKRQLKRIFSNSMNLPPPSSDGQSDLEEQDLSQIR